MSATDTIPQKNFTNFVSKITVFGCGGAGSNAINNMILSGLEHVNFIVANTDAQSLGYSLSDNKIQLGINLTRGLGAGTNPEIGRLAAEESIEEIRNSLKNTDLLFIAAGMGGGTGTGGAPVIAKLAKEMGILTISIVTKPFTFEGQRRMNIAEAGIINIETNSDITIIVANENLLKLANNKTGFAEGFKIADDVLLNSVKSIVHLLTKPGFINRDFADLKTVMSEMGRAMIGYCEASGENRHIIAAENAITNSVLENNSIEGASSLLINITGSTDMGLLEVQEIVEMVRKKVNPNANLVFGTVFNRDMIGSIQVTVIATGMNKASNNVDSPVALSENNQIKIEQKTEISNNSYSILSPTQNPNFDYDEMSVEEMKIRNPLHSFKYKEINAIDINKKIESHEENGNVINSKKKHTISDSDNSNTMPLFKNIYTKFIVAKNNIIQDKNDFMHPKGVVKSPNIVNFDIENEDDDQNYTPTVHRVA